MRWSISASGCGRSAAKSWADRDGTSFGSRRVSWTGEFLDSGCQSRGGTETTPHATLNRHYMTAGLAPSSLKHVSLSDTVSRANWWARRTSIQLADGRTDWFGSVARIHLSRWSNQPTGRGSKTKAPALRPPAGSSLANVHTSRCPLKPRIARGALHDYYRPWPMSSISCNHIACTW